MKFTLTADIPGSPIPVRREAVRAFEEWSSMTGRLNAFQKTMLQWNDLHAYNAVHMVEISGRLDSERLRTSIQEVLESRGLAVLTLDRSSNRFQYDGGRASCEIQLVEDGADPIGALVIEIERQLNRSFPCQQRFCPFRFLIAPAGDSFLLGLVYFHPVADAESVVLLLKEIAYHHRQPGASVFPKSLDLYPDGGAHLLSRHPWVCIRRLLGLPKLIRRLRRSHRVATRDAHDMANGFALFSVNASELKSLVAAAQAWVVTVNDLFLAILMKSLSPCAAERNQSTRRDQISLGCIVNTRRQLGVDSRNAFGLFLGSFIVTHEVPATMLLRELAEDVSRQTAVIKRGKLYLGTALELGFARFMFRCFSPRRQRTFYSKHWPLLGGVTNMNLNTLWEPSESDESAPVDYFRGVSTGPVTPLVLSVTTTGDHANLGLSYRLSVFSPADIEGVKNRFMGLLNETQRGA